MHQSTTIVINKITQVLLCDLKYSHPILLAYYKHKLASACDRKVPQSYDQLKINIKDDSTDGWNYCTTFKDRPQTLDEPLSTTCHNQKLSSTCDMDMPQCDFKIEIDVCKVEPGDDMNYEVNYSTTDCTQQTPDTLEEPLSQGLINSDCEDWSSQYTGDCPTDGPSKVSSHNQVHDGIGKNRFIDTRTESTSNRMLYVDCGRTEDKVNLRAYQDGGAVYYRSCKTIPVNEELLVLHGGNDAGDSRIERVPSDGVIKQRQSMPCEYSSDLNNTSQTQDVVHSDEKQKCVQASYNKTCVDVLNNTACTDERPYKCKQCAYSSSKSSNLRTHMRTHTGERPYKCKQCKYTCTQLCSLKSHMRTHTGERPYKRKQCEYTTTLSSHLKSHMRTHTRERPYKCKQCEYASTTSRGLKSHMKTHTGERPYKCKQCEYTSTQSGSLQCHMRTHTGERPYKCKQCEYSSKTSGNLKSHIKTHTGERPYKCKQCEYCSSQSSNLRTHMKTHTGERPYKCKQCKYTSTQSCSLKSHMRTHTGERPYKCKQCVYTSTQSGSLKSHMKTHTGERPYKCKQCE